MLSGQFAILMFVFDAFEIVIELPPKNVMKRTVNKPEGDIRKEGTNK